MTTIAGVFEARYHSGCLACEGHISPGNQVKWADESVIHAECLVLDDQFKPLRPICPRCFMEPSANGLCGCDE